MIRAARTMGIAPWELAEQPIIWQDMILAAEAAEAWAESEANAHAMSRTKNARN